MKHCIRIVLIVTIAFFSQLRLVAQQEVPELQIGFQEENDQYLFSVDTSLLPDLSIYPDAYFVFFWHFGDGEFFQVRGDNRNSFRVRHSFSPDWADRELEARLYISVHYAPYYYGGPGIKKFTVETTSADSTGSPPANCLVLRTNDILTDGINEIRLDEEFVLLTSIHCQTPINEGKIRIRTKPRSKGEKFTLVGYDAPGEAIKPDSSREITFLDAGIELPITSLGTARTSLFLYLKSEENDLLNKDISFEVTLFEGAKSIETQTITFKVVSTRDPNRMLVQSSVEDFDDFFENGLEYRIDFQNESEQPVLDGSGPNDGIALRIELPKGADASSFNLRAFHTATRNSGTEVPDSTDWTLLPGEKKSEVIVKLYGGLNGKSSDQLSKGYISYTVQPRSNIGKCPWKSVAHVQFGGARKEEKTNDVQTEFKGVISPGIKVGYNYFSGDKDRSYYFAGIELGSDVHCVSDSRLAVTVGVESLDSLFKKNYYIDIALTAIRVEPFRINNGHISLFSVGGGVQYSKAFLLDNRGNRVKPNIWSLFVDVNPISFRKGPRLGVQYHWNISNVNIDELDADFKQSQLQFYLTWAF